MTEPTVHVLMSRVMKDITAIEKSQRNAHFNFNFRGIDDVMNALHGPLTSHGVFYTPEVLEQEILRGDKQWHATLRVRYTFYGPAGDSVSAVVTAEGLDSADKAATKAMSTALKYALLQVFCIPTEEQREMDPDRSSETWASPRPEQAPSPSPTTGGKASGEVVAKRGDGPTSDPGPSAEQQPGAVPSASSPAQPAGGATDASQPIDPSAGEAISKALSSRKLKADVLRSTANALALKRKLKPPETREELLAMDPAFLTELAQKLNVAQELEGVGS